MGQFVLRKKKKMTIQMATKKIVQIIERLHLISSMVKVSFSVETDNLIWKYNFCFHFKPQGNIIFIRYMKQDLHQTPATTTHSFFFLSSTALSVSIFRLFHV